MQRTALASMPEVISRKSRYSYGILEDVLPKDLIDFDPLADKIHIDPEGHEIVLRMHWYLHKVREDQKMGKENSAYQINRGRKWARSRP